MIPYSKVLSIIKKEKGEKNLLLGAGFSVAFNKGFKIDEQEVLSRYESDEAKELSNAENSKRLMEYVSPTVFEFRNNKLVQNKKATIVQELRKVHPKGICEIKESEADKCFEFLSIYLNRGHVFTLNYDLLLYWASIRAVKTKTQGYKDGFRSLNSTGNGWSWDNTEDVNVYYCHGAVNLYSKNSCCFKTAHDQFCFLPIEKGLRKKSFNPLCVSAKTSEEKKDYIKSNNYLSACLRALESISGILVILGFSASENDEHILEAIKIAQDKNGLVLYFGVYKDSDVNRLKSTLIRHGLRYQFFDSRTTCIWR